jgi:hypothetical protein
LKSGRVGKIEVDVISFCVMFCLIKINHRECEYVF